MNDTELPTVPGSIAGQVTTVARYAAVWLGGILVAKGWISGGTAELITAVTATATPILMGMAATRLSRIKIKQAVEVAKSKGDSAT